MEPLKIPINTEVNVRLQGYDEDGSYPEFVATEVVDKRKEKEAKEMDDDEDFLIHYEFPKEHFGIHIPTLRVDIDSIKVHFIKSVNFKTEAYPVTRSRYEKEEEEDQEIPEF